MKYTLKYLLTATTMLSSSAFATATPDFSALTKHIERIKAETRHSSATAIAVIKEGKLIHENYFGYADIGQHKLANRTTGFYIASATKPFFALSMLLKESAGKLDTRNALHTAFPELSVSAADVKSVTMKDLLVHTSGLDNQPLVWATAFSGLHDHNARLRMVAGSLANQAAPHGMFQYTNVGYNIASVWLEQAFATTWQQQVKETVLDPLGMTRTSPYISDAKANGWLLAKPYSLLSTTPQVPLYLEKTDQTMHAAGGLISTAPDLANFLIAQLEQGSVAGRQSLPAAVIQESHRQQVRTASEYLIFKRDGYAWGWYTGEFKGVRMLHHFGAFAGFHAHLSFIPEKRIGLVVLNNEDILGSQLTALIAGHVYGTLLGEADVNAATTATAETLLAKAKTLPHAVSQQQQKLQGRSFMLSQPPQQYVGSYEHELLGKLTIELNANRKFVVRFGELVAIASGFDRAEHLRVELVPNSGDLLVFEIVDGKVAAVKLDGMNFRKKA